MIPPPQNPKFPPNPKKKNVFLIIFSVPFFPEGGVQKPEMTKPPWIEIVQSTTPSHTTVYTTSKTTTTTTSTTSTQSVLSLLSGLNVSDYTQGNFFKNHIYCSKTIGN